MRAVGRNIAVLYVLFFHIQRLTAQTNLVPNPSFETFSSCPTGQGQLNLATAWINPTGCTPEYFNQCNGGSYGVPNNVIGNEAAKSGVAYAGFYAYQPTNVREYIQVLLMDTLESGKKYLVEFYVSLAENIQYAVSTVGAFFSPSPIIGNNCDLLQLTPQILNPNTNLLNSKIGWMRVSDTLTSIGGELYMTIGNFNSDSTSDTLYVGGGSMQYSYYFIDDVSVTEIINSGVPTNEEIPWFSLYPNPAPDGISVYIYLLNAEHIEFELYDPLGRKVLQKELFNGLQKIDLREYLLSNSVYFYKVKQQNTYLKTGKFLIAK